MVRFGTRQQVSVVVMSGLLLSGGLAGCSSSTTTSGGSASPTPATSAPATDTKPNNVADADADAVLEEAKKAAQGAKSVRVASTSEQGSEKQSFDLVLTKDGSQGSMSQSAGSFEMIAVPETIYIKGDDAFNSSFAGGEASKLLGGKWLSIPADGTEAQNFKPMSSSTEFFGQLLTSDRKLTKTTETKEVNGVVCLGLTDEGKGTMWIATTGEPYPMSIDPPAEQNGTLTFTDWNADVTIEPPPADEVIDISKLQSAAPTP